MSRATRVLATLTLSLSVLEVEAQQPIPATSVSAFYLCRASLGIVGAGTIVFHSIDDTQSQYSRQPLV